MICKNYGHNKSVLRPTLTDSETLSAVLAVVDIKNCCTKPLQTLLTEWLFTQRNACALRLGLCLHAIDVWIVPLGHKLHTTLKSNK